MFLDFYGTVVWEDEVPIQTILQRIFQTGTAKSLEEIGTYWWRRFSALCAASYGGAFRTQRELELQSLRETLARFESKEDAAALSQLQFDYWRKPPLFADAKPFFAACPCPIYIVSNIDDADLHSALRFHHLAPAGAVTSERAKAYKPRPELFQYALRTFHLEPGDVVHIGDSVTNDVLGAKAAGINAIWLNRKGKPSPTQGIAQTADLPAIWNLI